MRKMHQSALLATLLAFTALSMPGTADAAGFDQFIAFGDSTLDTGYFRYHPSGNAAFDTALPLAIQQGATGGFAGNGVMNTTILANKFGLNIAPSSNGGTNYANGGATTIVNNAPDYPNNITTIQQIENYLTSVNHVANPRAFYLIKTGDNDATYVNNQLAIDPNWLNIHPNYLRDGAIALSWEVQHLQAAGARNIMVRNSYDSAVFAGLGGDIAPANTAAYARSKSLGAWEWMYLTDRGVRFIPADNDSLFSYVVHHPNIFGFQAQNVLSSSAPFFMVKSAALCILTPAEQRDYLFIDGVHLTTAGQTIEADYEYSLLIAPSQMSLLAENAVQLGWARAATIQGQIEASAQHRGPCGRNFWTSAGGGNLRVRNAQGFADDSGAPAGATVGVDFLTADGFIVGAAFSAGGQSQNFSTGGRFDQADEAPSVYAAYMDGPLWGNAVLTYDMFQDRISRPVPLGLFTDQNYGSTAGQSVALALRGGGDVNLGWITTGPVAGLVLQHVRVNGFTESGLTGVTALAFDSQTRDSCVSQLGWRVLADRGRWRPFAEVNWNHEFTGRDRTVTTWLTSVAAASYTMDAVPVGSDWTTSSLGAFYQLSPRTILRGAVSAMFGNSQMESVGGELGLNVSF